jgi:protease YdgD
VDVAAWPWSALVLVQVPGVARCTGFMLDPRTVMTAAHCLFLPRVRHMARPDDIHVLSGYARGDYRGHSLITRYSTASGWDPGDEHRAPGADAAVLTLATPLPGGALGLTPGQPGQAAMLGGYEQDRAQVLLADTDCRVMGLAGDAGGLLRQHSCTATSGASGAPLLARDPAGRWAVAGLQIAAERGVAGGLAVDQSTLAALIASK